MFGIKKSRVKRFGIVLALISSLTSACKNELPADQFRDIKLKINQVEIGLRSGKPNKEADNSLVKELLKLKRQGFIIAFSENFSKGIDYLTDFYIQYDLVINNLENNYYPGTGFNVNWTNRLIQFQGGVNVRNDNISKIVIMKNDLIYSKVSFGFVPEEEKTHLIDLLDTLIKLGEELLQPVRKEGDKEFVIERVKGLMNRDQIQERLKRLLSLLKEIKAI